MKESSLRQVTLPFIPRQRPHLFIAPALVSILVWSWLGLLAILHPPLTLADKKGWLFVVAFCGTLTLLVWLLLMRSKWKIFDDHFEVTTGWKSHAVAFADIFRMECDTSPNKTILIVQCHFRTRRAPLEFFLLETEYAPQDIATGIGILEGHVSPFAITESARKWLEEKT